MRFNEFHDEQTDEMIGVKKYHDLTIPQLMKQLSQDLGLPLLGRGAFGQVIQSPDPKWVYKIYENDSAYDDFIQYALSHKNNPHLPKIKKVKQMTNFLRRYAMQEDKFTVVMIKKLQPLPEKKSEFVVSFLKTPWDVAPGYLPTGVSNRERLTVEQIANQPWEGWRTNELKNLWKTSDEIHHQLMSFGRFIDLHEENVMQDERGSVVITDPVAAYDALDYGSDISHQRATGKPMIKGPHYKTQPAVATPYDDPDNPLPPGYGPSDPYQVPHSMRSQLGFDKTNTNQWDDNFTKKAHDRFWKLHNQSTPLTDKEEEERLRLMWLLKAKGKFKPN